MDLNAQARKVEKGGKLMQRLGAPGSKGDRTQRMKTYLIVVETKARYAAGQTAYHAEPWRMALGIECPGGAVEAMQEYMRRAETDETRRPGVFVLYPLNPDGFGAAQFWIDPATLATFDPAGWLVATGRLERIGPVEVKKSDKR